MKALLTLALMIFGATLLAQDNVHEFQATKVNVNKQGERIETSTPEPSKIRVDFVGQTITIETSSPEIRELLKDDLEFTIEKQLGEIGQQYSFLVDEKIFAHFYLDGQMIVFTRNDVHPLQWGIQFLEVQKL